MTKSTSRKRLVHSCLTHSFVSTICLSLSGTVGVRFPSTFMSTAKTILRRLFRVYAHIYHSHFDQICALGIEGELNPCCEADWS